MARSRADLEGMDTDAAHPSTSKAWNSTKLAADLGRHWKGQADVVSDALLFLMLVVQWTTNNQSISATLAAIWLLWSLATNARRDASGGGWSAPWPLMLILVLNLRGLVYQEGPQPVSHMDYIIIIAAFVAGMGRLPRRWIRSIAAILAAGVLGFALNLNPFLRSVTAIFNGTANVAGWNRQVWAGQYFRAGEMSVNQTAFLTGITFTLCLCACLQSRGLLRRLAGLAGMVMAAMAFATGSRLALLLAPMAAAASMVIAAALNRRIRSNAPEPRSVSVGSRLSWIRTRAAALLLTVSAVAAGLVLFQPGRTWLLDNYVGRKLAGDQDRLDVLACYVSLAFSDGSRLLLGAGYGEAWRRFCDQDVGITVSHAHNFVAQLMGETGLPATLGVLLALAAPLFPLIKQFQSPRGHCSASSAGSERQTVMTLFLAAYLYIISFALFELAFLKVTVLECLIGYLLSMSLCGNSEQASAQKLQPITSFQAL
jgi:hypothetical protein